MPKLYIRCIAMLAALLGIAQAALATDIMVMNATARATLTPQATSTAVYFSVMNHSAADDKLLSVSSPNAKSATLHDTQLEGDIMKMREISGGLMIGTGKTVELKPGSLHIMLTGLNGPLKKGDTLPMDLMFEKAGLVQVRVPVGEIAATHDHTQ